MVILLWLVNFGISWLNAWGCGKSWTESKHAGGVPHFLNWCGAIMSAAGFTWCYLVVLGGAATMIPIEAEDGTTAPLLSGASAQAFADLGYMLVIFPIIGTGLALTVHSWGVFWRERNFANGATAGWNSFAQVYNTMNALEHVPQASRRLGAFFGGDDVKDKTKGLVVLLVALAAIGGILPNHPSDLAVHRARNGVQPRAPILGSQLKPKVCRSLLNYPGADPPPGSTISDRAATLLTYPPHLGVWRGNPHKVAMNIPDHLLPLITAFRPQLEGESDRQYLSNAFTSAQRTSLRALERLVDNMLVAFGDVEPLEDVR